jgi:DNA-binding HxlR family transcriptional regulator
MMMLFVKVIYMNDETRNLLKIIGSAKTVEILEYLREHGTAQHRDLNAFVNTHTLYRRIAQLIHYGLIEHHYERYDVKKEWYTLTEKGDHILKCVYTVVELLGH